jgi:hypothetical protein
VEATEPANHSKLGTLYTEWRFNIIGSFACTPANWEWFITYPNESLTHDSGTNETILGTINDYTSSYRYLCACARDQAGNIGCDYYYC